MSANALPVSALCLLLLGCGSTSDLADGGPRSDRLAGTWAGSCQAVPQGFGQARIAFASGSVAIRANLYGDAACTRLLEPGTRVTSGTYVELGPGDTAPDRQVDFEIGAVADGAHQEVLPARHDLYRVADGRLFFGDPSSGDGSSPERRPAATGGPGLAFVGSDVSGVFTIFAGSNRPAPAAGRLLAASHGVPP